MPQVGSDLLCETLSKCGVDSVYGVPGTQNVSIFEALRKSNSISTYVGSSELSSGFSAIGHFKQSGSIAAVTCIPGPGFLFALPAVAEALHDSAAMLVMVPRREKAQQVQELQRIEQEEIIKPLVKSIFRVRSVADIPKVVPQACSYATSGEPGPVYLEIEPSLLDEEISENFSILNSEFSFDSSGFDSLTARIEESRRMVLLLGGGCWSAEEEVRDLVRHLGCPALLTCSARGLLADDDPQHLRYDFSFGGGCEVNRLLSSSDCVVVLGAKLSHNGTGGFCLDLEPSKLIRVDASNEAFGRDYEASLNVLANLQSLVPDLLKALPAKSAQWDSSELEVYSKAFAEELAGVQNFLPSLSELSCAEFFGRVSSLLSNQDFSVTTDSGLHQSLVRQFFKLPEGKRLICPTDFQSMGFGVPAAVGAAAASNKPVLSFVGDGGCLMTGAELSTAKKYSLPVKVFVFSDGQYGLIRLQQLTNYGHPFGTELASINLKSFAEGFDLNFCDFTNDSDRKLQNFLSNDEPCLIQVNVRESTELRTAALTAKAKEQLRSLLGPRLIGALKKMRG